MDGVKRRTVDHATLAATTITVTSGTRITCTFRIPGWETNGPWDVRVMNGDNQAGTTALAFTVTI